MSISKETLMAYVDGELNAEMRAQVEAAMALDPLLMREVEKQQALREQLQSTFADVLQEPVPDRLIAAARTAPAAAKQGNVVELAGARANKAGKIAGRWALPQWAAMAACLVVGVFIGHQLLRSPASGPVASENGHLVARGALAQALSTQLASEPSPNEAVHIAVTFRDGDGNYCRTFALKDGSALAGLACRQDNAWRVEALSQGSPENGGSGGYRMAGAELPPSVLQAVQERIEGDPLDAAGEQTAREKRWK